MFGVVSSTQNIFFLDKDIYLIKEEIFLKNHVDARDDVKMPKKLVSKAEVSLARKSFSPKSD